MPRAIELDDPVAALNAAIRKTSIEEMEAAVGSAGKRYPTASRLLLPPDLPPAFSRSLGDVMKGRASDRSFSTSVLSLNEISALCRVTNGRNDHRLPVEDSPVAFRFTPSAGALYPLELYLLAVQPLQLDGNDSRAEIWHYEPGNHCLERIHRCDSAVIASCFQTWPANPPPLVALITGVPKRQSWKYGPRAYRYTLLEAGHAAQNLVLATTALELNSCPVVGFYDDVIHDLLDIDGLSEVALYTVFIGRKSEHKS